MEHKVTLVVGKNGSIEVINDESDVEQWGELSTLGLLLISSTVLNFSLVGIGLQGKSKGTMDIAPMSVALGLSNALDSVVNITLGLIFIAFWPRSSPPESVCRLSATSYLAALLLQPLNILAHFLFHISHRQQISSTPLQIYLFIMPPLVAGALSSPMLLPNVMKVHHFISRHNCGIVGDNIAYSAGLILFGFFISWAAITYYLIVRRCTCGDAAHHSCREDRDFRYIVTIAAMAVIFSFPASVSFSISSMTHLANLSTYRFSIEDILIITGTYDTILTWGRYLFNLLCPIVALTFYKPLFKECFQILISSKEGSISSCYIQNAERNSKYIDSLGGPVLFVTSRGLMLIRNSSDEEPSFNELCDLVDHEQQLANPLQTSINPYLLSTSFHTDRTKKKSGKKGKRKIVRFAQSVKEIPRCSDD